MRALVQRRSKRRNSGLLLTPLVDIIFLLVIFFILNTSFRQEPCMDVQLPESETAEEVQTDGLILTIGPDGRLELNGQEVIWSELTARVLDAWQQSETDTVVIQADDAVPYGSIVRAMDGIRMAGVETLSLQTVRPVE